MAANAGSSCDRPRLRTLTALLLALPVCAAASDHLAVTAVRYWSLGDVTRIAIETNGTFTYRTERLYRPSRVFYDLKDARPQLGPKGVHIVTINDPRVKQVRVAETQPSVTRIVLDLEDGQFDVVASQLSVPDRLVIEVRMKGDIAAPSPILSSTGMKRIPDVSETAAVIKPERKIPEAPVLDLKNTGLKPPPLAPVFVRGTIPEPKLEKKPVERKSQEPPVLASKQAPMKSYPLPTLGGSAAAPPPEPMAASSLPAPAPASIPPPAANAQPAKRNSNGDRSLTRTLGLKIRRVVLDPGHGGHDHGSTGPGGLAEKELVLDVSKRLGALIEQEMGSEVVYTRTNDTFIPLEDRPAVANAKKADIFLSIHANSSPIRTVSGVETYYLSFTTSRTAMDVAARENAVSTKSISDLKELLQKIAMKDKVEESREFAARVQSSLVQLTPMTPAQRTAARRGPDRGVKKAPFVVLIGATMPSVLAEIGFVSNAKEESMMRKPEYRQKIAEALFKGLQGYAESLSQFQVAQRAKPASE